MQKETPSENLDISSVPSQDNIFDELSSNMDIRKEVEKHESRKEKGAFYYIWLVSSWLIAVNMILFFIVILFMTYSYVQSTTTSKNFAFLAPICERVISNVNDIWSCYSVNYLLIRENGKLEALKEQQANDVARIFWDLYSFENFHLSKKMVFLLDRTTNRLQPTKILSAFDELKNRYSSVDKSEITCGRLELSMDNILKVSCDIYSSDWDTKVITFQNGIKTFINWWGTSISKAASFIDFLKNFEESPFRVMQQNTVFSSEEVQTPPYTQKTTIVLALEYSTFNIDN